MFKLDLGWVKYVCRVICIYIYIRNLYIITSESNDRSFYCEYIWLKFLVIRPSPNEPDRPVFVGHL